MFAANIYERLGYGVIPNGTESRHDIIQAVELGSAEGVIAFCKGIRGGGACGQLCQSGTVGNAGI